MTRASSKTSRRVDPLPFIIAAFSALSSVRVWLLRDVIFDDNAWLQIIYSTSSLEEFLAMGFFELRRVPLGCALYPLLLLHKSTEHFYIVWHFLDTITQIGSPILLYLLITAVFPTNRGLALFSAVSLTVFPLDHTLGYFSAINYRLGLLLSLLSMYVTARGLSAYMPTPIMLLGSLLPSAIAYYVFIEGAIALEPGRLLLIWHILRRKGRTPDGLTKATLVLWSPFFLLTLPLVLYKLLYKPYGLYEGAYSTQLVPVQMAKNLASLIYFQAIELYHSLHYWSTWSLLLSLCAAVLSFLVLRALPELHSQVSLTSPCQPRLSLWQALLRSFDAQSHALWLGLTFLLFPTFLLLYADRALGGNMNSSHAALLQIGSSIIIGTLLSALYSASHSLKSATSFLVISLLSVLLGLGVYANNKYLDLFFESWREQTLFWDTFRKALPTLPERANFFVDVEDNAIFSDLRIYYDFEFQMNLLYARSKHPADFRRYRVYTLDEWTRSRSTPQSRGPAQNEPGRIVRETHYGIDVFSPTEFIFLYYRNGKLLVNRDILKRYPRITYARWLEKAGPPSPSQLAPSYVFRTKMRPFD